MLLKEPVLAPVAAIRVRITEVQTAIDFDGDASVRTEQVHLHETTPVERDWEIGSAPVTLLCCKEIGSSGWIRAENTERSEGFEA
jgi:hypothetical protein